MKDFIKSIFKNKTKKSKANETLNFTPLYMSNGDIQQCKIIL